MAEESRVFGLTMSLSKVSQSTTQSTTPLIKQSICWRAKYRTEKKAIPPLKVVPHPCNRDVKSLRTKELNGTIVYDGYDTIEANVNAVLVEDKPAVAGGTCFFQEEFVKNLKNDPDMMQGSDALGGSLSHSHLNCLMRNILGKKRGCECQDKNVCCCFSGPILDEHGCDEDGSH